MPFTKQGDKSRSDHHQRGGIVLDRGWRYDLEVWFFDTVLLRGRITELHQLVLEMAEFSSSERLLDVGCGTGTLTIQAARLLGGGQVTGVDPAPRQLARGRSKAARAGVDIDFRQGVIEELAFPDESFDIVTSTLMMHHLPAELKQRGLAEISRVLTPRGRLVIADFDYADNGGQRSEPADNGYAGTAELPQLVEQQGFTIKRSSQTSFPRAHHGWSGARVLAAAKT